MASMKEGRRVALSFPDATNPSERAQAESGRLAARRLGLEVLTPHFASNGPVAQIAALFEFKRGGASGYVVLPVRPDTLLNVAETLVRSGGSMVFLNRPPAGVDRLRSLNKDPLVATVLPDQVQVGRLQGEQCRKLVPRGGFVLYVTGTLETPSAQKRRQGLLEVLEGAIEMHELQGRWTEESGYDAVAQWLAVGAERRRRLDAVVCQNDAMAVGVRRALFEQAAKSGRHDLARTALLGVDGLDDHGLRRVREGDLAATVKIPLTAAPAIGLLADFWKNGERKEELVLPAEPYPALDQLEPLR
jgi:ABC-type sugar transport system substrate-binding protein